MTHTHIVKVLYKLIINLINLNSNRIKYVFHPLWLEKTYSFERKQSIIWTELWISHFLCTVNFGAQFACRYGVCLPCRIGTQSSFATRLVSMRILRKFIFINEIKHNWGWKHYCISKQKNQISYLWSSPWHCVQRKSKTT